MRKTTRKQIVIPDDPSPGPPLLLDLLLLPVVPFGTIVGVYFLLKRGRSLIIRQKLQDYRHYAAIIGDRRNVSLREMATRLGKTPEMVAADIQAMIDEGMIVGEAVIDRQSMILYLKDGVIDTEFAKPASGAQTPPPASRRAAPAEAPKARPAPTPEPEPPRPRPKPRPAAADTDDFEAKLREIRRLNEEIDNEVVSQRIDRIGALTASIFSVVREKPEQTAEVRKFMNYYLPTTLKLLKSYSLMEKQSYQGENIAASRRKIEDVLETLVHAFEHQQDRLFQAEALDVETDINVLETMLANDGLTGEGRGLHL